MKYKRKAVVVRATRWVWHGDHPLVKCGREMRDAYLENKRGKLMVNSGDWIIETDEDVYVCSNDVFRKEYKNIDDKVFTPGFCVFLFFWMITLFLTFQFLLRNLIGL